jgi:hypothetical protein
MGLTLPVNQLSGLNQNPTNDGDGATVLPEIDENLVNNLNIEINGHITSEEILHNFSEKTFNLVSNTAVNNLPKQLKIVIGRKFFGSK